MRVETISGVKLSPSPAIEAFLGNFGKVASLYEYDWTKQESFEQRAAYLKGGGYKGDRKALAAALAQYNEALGAGSATMESIRLLGREGTLAVVTGQQPGIFAGPAYSIYKAVTAVLLARQQSERLGLPVVPVFWVAGEDHDWLEVASVLAPAGDGMTRLALKESFDGWRQSVGLAPIPGSLSEVLDEFAALLPDTEFKAGVVERIREASQGDPALAAKLTMGKPTLADWFARLVTWLFEGSGLLIVNSADPALRRLEASFFARAISQFETTDAALGKGYERMEALGFQPTVDRQVGNVNLFTYVNGERLPIAGAGDQFWIRNREEIAWSKEDLLDRAATHPELFSTNVVLRPVVQGFLFPDLAFIGGPGEISYFGLYRDVYQAFDQQMPIVYPRQSFTLVEPPMARSMEKQELSLLDVFYRLDEKKQELLQREDRLGITDTFEQFRQAFGEQYEQLVGTVLQLDPNLHFVTDENRKQIAVQINKLEEKAKQQHRKNCEVALRQFDRLSGHLFPGGLQERTVSFLPYLAKYGPDLVTRMLAEVELGDGWEHQAIYLGT